MYVRTKQWQRGCQDASGKQTYDQREGVIVAGMGILGPSADLPETFLRATVGVSSTVCAGERKVRLDPCTGLFPAPWRHPECFIAIGPGVVSFRFWLDHYAILCSPVV